MKNPRAILKAVAGRVFSFPFTLPLLSLYKIQNRNVLTNQPTPWNREADGQPSGQEISFLLWHCKIYYCT